jgi:mannose-6-phosphate isomerase-like protein (cupin superfamily)
MPCDPSYVFVTKQLSADYDYHAPDGSEIRLLPWVRGGSLAHCTLPPGKTTQAVLHHNVEELWYCISGAGQIWRKLGDLEQVVDLDAGSSVTLPTGMRFQFRATGSAPLCILIATMPPWPSKEEAVAVDGHWEI